jgi:nucleoside-diphosphate-sugar epimerase
LWTSHVFWNIPATPPGSLILVTGASGFLGVHTVKVLLDAGFPVRGTVRSNYKGEYLIKLFKDSKVPFEYVIVGTVSVAVLSQRRV